MIITSCILAVQRPPPARLKDAWAFLRIWRCFSEPLGPRAEKRPAQRLREFRFSLRVPSRPLVLRTLRKARAVNALPAELGVAERNGVMRSTVGVGGWGVQLSLHERRAAQVPDQFLCQPSASGTLRVRKVVILLLLLRRALQNGISSNTTRSRVRDSSQRKPRDDVPAPRHSPLRSEWQARFDQRARLGAALECGSLLPLSAPGLATACLLHCMYPRLRASPSGRFAPYRRALRRRVNVRQVPSSLCGPFGGLAVLSDVQHRDDGGEPSDSRPALARP